MITLTLSQLLALGALATFAGIGAYAVGSAAAGVLAGGYRQALEKISSQRRWHEACRKADADYAAECMAHRVTRNTVDQLRAENRALRMQVAGRAPDMGGEPALMRERFMRDLDIGAAGTTEETKDL